MSVITTCYYDRKNNTIEGAFTVRSFDTILGRVVKEFTRLPSRSGQRGYENQSWVRSKSPIPYSNELVKPYKLWIDKPDNKGKWAGAKGIGAFYPISTENDRVTIIGLNGLPRKEIGWHPENLFPGSLGCIASLADTNSQRQVIEEVWDYFDYLARHGEKFVGLEVL